MVVRWQFYDPTGPTTVTLPLNPREGGAPAHKKAIEESGVTSPDGLPVYHEGMRPGKRIEFTGVILVESHYTLLYDWWDRDVSIRLTDDLGRVMWVYFEDFTPRRVRSAIYPWKHEYTMTAVVLSGDP